MNNIHVSYDEFADVLYLSVGKPKASYSTQGENGIVWRKTQERGIPSAVTVIDFKDFWLSRREHLVNEIASKLHIARKEIEKKLPNAKI